jgi:hypothetical protein
MKYLKTFEKLFESHSDYLKWKRKNVTFRGVSEIGKENNGGARFGDGLYTAALSNKDMAKTYGNVYFVVGAVPKHPKIFNNTNDCEIWIHRFIYYANYKTQTEFYKNTTVKDEMLKLGYDGIIIKGREMVNYTPDMDNIKYFKNEREVEEYYENY